MSNPITTFASVTLGNVTINEAPSAPKHAVTVEYVETQISNLVDSAPGTLNTLGEIATALQASDSNVAGAITASIAAVATSVAQETERALGVEAATDLQVLANVNSIAEEKARAEDEEGRIEALVSSNSQSIQSNSEFLGEEQTRAQGEEGRIEGLVASNLSGINVLSGSKFNKAGGDINGSVTVNGNMQLPSSYFLYIGSNWRIEAYGTELHFRYSADGLSWGSGIPFVSV